MKKPKPGVKLQSRPKPAVSATINNCTFNGSDSAGVIALAEALKANAEAIKELCDCVRTPQPLLWVGDK